MVLFIRTALPIVLCLACVSCGGTSEKVEDSSRKVEGSCGALRLLVQGSAAYSAQGALGRLDVHGVECRTARGWLEAYASPGNALTEYTCRDTLFCWRGASSSNAEHAPHWFRLSFEFVGRAKNVEGSCGAYVFRDSKPSLNPATVHVHGVECGIARILLDLENVIGRPPPGYACKADGFFCWRGASAAHAEQAPHWYCISFRTEKSECSRLSTRVSSH
jgi:hypothetical protein